MLVLTMKDGHGLQIGETHIQMYIEGGQAKLYIDAPKSIPIIRDNAIKRYPLYDLKEEIQEGC